MFKRFVVSGTKKDNILTGTDRLDIMFGKNGDDVLEGRGGWDVLFGGKGNDQLFGEGGNDKLFGGKGNDSLDGGAGSDYLFGGKGDDTFNFTLSENSGAKDYYNGGKGFDTLQLTLTSAELKQESVQKDIADFEAFLARKGNGDDGNAFQFKSFDLNVRNFQDLKIVEVGGGNTEPVANPDLGVLVSEDAVALAIDVLANDTDADGDTLSLVTAVVVADGLGTAAAVGTQVVYNPGDAYQFLGAGASANVKIDYTISDEHGATASSFVDVLVTGVNDAPVAVDDDFDGLSATKFVSPIKIAVVGGASSSYTLARDQLNDSTVFDFSATAIAYTNERDWADLNVDNYDVVVLGESGFFDYMGETGSLFTALNTFVGAGGGVVTTGLFAFALSNGALSAPVRALADSITPIAPGWTNDDLGFLNTPITVSDLNHEIVRGVANANDVYLSNALIHEFAPNLDAGASELATGISMTGAEVTAIAYDVEVGRVDGDAQMPGGNTAYLGAAYLGSGVSGVREGVSDQIFEQAIAWAAGARGTATVNINPADLLENDSDPDSAFAISALSSTGLYGAVSFDENGNIVYALGEAGLQKFLDDGSITDSFEYTIGDGNLFDTASVSLTIDNLL
ncbi:MAG TPA: Ig-like domain-containing protein [Burkholderiales bacterium]|nr:Ig-like domain-containing protein [Burkholderiales bacterium]